ncbi:MAG: hypothetical protein WCV90_08050 [Candidatus Woesearchaeota archaeon]
MLKGVEHHQHLRKRIHLQHQAYPHPSKGVRYLDRLIYCISIVGPFTTVPQIYDIYSQQNAVGVSLITWSLYALLGIPMLIYAMVHKVKPLIIMYSLWLVIYAFVLTGIVMYS